MIQEDYKSTNPLSKMSLRSQGNFSQNALKSLTTEQRKSEYESIYTVKDPHL